METLFRSSKFISEKTINAFACTNLVSIPFTTKETSKEKNLYVKSYSY